MNRGYSRRSAIRMLSAGAAMIGTPALSFVGSEFDTAEAELGNLPPVDERLPRNPRVVDVAALGGTVGRYGGTLRILIGSQRDVRIVPLYGYARLVGYDRELNFQPDILSACDVENDEVFTFHLREGHRWSDGNPLTVEDFRYAWEDVLMHPDLPGVPSVMKPGGTLPRFEVIDDLTVRFSWPTPNPEFLPSLAAPVPPQIPVPSAYLKQFHAKYQDAETLAQLTEEYRVDDWTSLHTKLGRANRPLNPDLPTLEPWRPRTAPPSQRFVFQRNPYFHRVDETGQQLPYVDQLYLDVSSYEIIPAKAAAGDSDLQAAGIGFSQYPVLKQAEKYHPINVSLWKTIQGSRLALYPNLTCADAVWSPLLRDVRVRRAMSLAIDRTEINKALFFGLCRESANTLLPVSPMFRQEFSDAWAYHDPEQANALLDAAGFSKIGLDGRRKLPDGRVAGIIVETAGESAVETDMLELITEQFRRIGITLWTRSSQRDIFRSRVLAGQVLMSVWYGLDNGIATADMPPVELAPTSEDQLQWPAWGAYYLSGGKQGSAPELPEAKRLIELMRAWQQTMNTASRAEIWQEMLQINADQVFSIGTICETPQPILRARDLRNVPEHALYGYFPTSMLGIYNPDVFWRDTGES